MLGSLVKDFVNNKRLIANAIQLNPREVKRFINNVILAKSIFDKPIDELIAVQALRLRDEWKWFLESATDNDNRRNFLLNYTRLKKTLTKETDDRQMEKKISRARSRFPAFRDLLDLKVLRHGNSLTIFLDNGGIQPLLHITKLEDYRRALATVQHQPSEEAEALNEAEANIIEEKVQEYNKLHEVLVSGSVCDNSLWTHVQSPGTRRVIAQCITVSGIVAANRIQQDFSYHIRLRVDPEFVNLTTRSAPVPFGYLVVKAYTVNAGPEDGSKYLCHLCQSYHQNIKLASVGTHVTVTGSYVLDSRHGLWAAIDPATSILLTEDNYKDQT